MSQRVSLHSQSTLKQINARLWPVRLHSSTTKRSTYRRRAQLANSITQIEQLPKGNSHTWQLKSKIFPHTLCWWVKTNKKNPRSELYTNEVTAHQLVKRILTKSFCLSQPESTCHVSTGSFSKEQRTIGQFVALLKIPLVLGFYVWSMHTACLKPGLHSNSIWLYTQL